MDTLKDQILTVIKANSEEQLAGLSRQFARASSAEKEAILAEIQFGQFMVEACQSSLGRYPPI